MITLGIDPGTRLLGWGVVRSVGNRLEHVAHGVVRTRPQASLAQRLADIDRALVDVLDQFKPDIGSVESLFFHKDAQAAAKLGHARGVVLLNLARANISVFEYAPARVKRTITGHGQADKRQVALMIRTLLSLRSPPPSDAADALALAVTHLRRAPIDRLIHGTNAPPSAVRPARPRRGRPGVSGKSALNSSR